MSGHTGYQAGLAAEEIAMRHYSGRGHATVARRWRGRSGEIDLIVRDGDGLVFVEVKKSGSMARAAERITRRQMDRICGAATEFVADQPNGMLTDMRFDLALVDGAGRVEVLENAFMEAA